jgi:hypothetical protein
VSIEVITRAWKYSQHGGSTLLLLMALADWADDWGFCYPGHEAMARKIRSSERNVYYLLRRLEESGEIRVINRGRGGKSSETTIYQVIVGMSEQEIAESERRLSALGISLSPANFAPPANFSPEKSFTALNVLINRQYTAAESINSKQQQNDVSPAKFAGEKSFTEKLRKNGNLPAEIKDTLKRLGWRGSLADVETAWQADPERVRQWLWYAGKQGWNGALLRTVLRNAGEYPPELDPDSSQSRRRYLEGPYADLIEH